MILSSVELTSKCFFTVSGILVSYNIASYIIVAINYHRNVLSPMIQKSKSDEKLSQVEPHAVNGSNGTALH